MLLPMRVASLALVHILVSVGACASEPEEFSHVGPECKALSGSLVVQICAENCEIRELHDGVFEPIDSAESKQRFQGLIFPRGGAKASHRWGDAGVNIARTVGGQKLDNPLVVSPSGALAVSAVAPLAGFDEYAPKKAIALVDAATGAIVWSLTLDGYLDTVAWSPNGATIAALISAPAAKPKRGETDAVAGVFGWRVAHSRAWIEVIDTAGHLLCKIDIYADLKTPTNNLRWDP